MRRDSTLEEVSGLSLEHKRPRDEHSDSRQHIEREEQSGSGKNCVKSGGIRTNFAEARKEILSRIEEFILGLQPSLDPMKASALAQTLDTKLYKASPTFETYSDPATLEDRLKVVATQIGLQLRSKSKRDLLGRNKCFVDERREMLRKKVGDELYHEVFDLVEEIKAIRKTNSTWTTAMPSSCSQGDRIQHEKQASDSMPPTLTAIYFRTRLVEAEAALMAKTLSLQPERVDGVRWEELVKEARENVTAFRKMEKEAKLSGKGKFGCSKEDGTCCFKW